MKMAELLSLEVHYIPLKKKSEVPHSKRDFNGYENSTDQTRPRGYKKIFLLNAAKQGILNAHKNKNIKKFNFLSDSDKARMLFFLLINVTMPTVVGIFTCISRKNLLLS